jgi:SAM-dependent methyltransferase
VAGGEWEPDAENWVRWARSPTGDAYWVYRDSFFDTVLPDRRGRTLEIGCGEGRVARDLVARGVRLAAVDTSPTLLRYARQEDAQTHYVQAGGAALPFRSGCFGLVVAYNALQVVDDMAATVREAARVLEVGGHLCACVSHPVTDLGRFLDDETRSYALRSDYFETVRVEEAVQREDGATMTFRGWTYPLEAYFAALERAGLLVEALIEPRPPQSAANYSRWRDVPLFMSFRGVKRTNA